MYSNNKSIYTYNNGLYYHVGSFADFTYNEKQLTIREIDSSSELIENNDVFVETQDHLLNYIGKIHELKGTNESTFVQRVNMNHGQCYYTITQHEKHDTDNIDSKITYYVMYVSVYP